MDFPLYDVEPYDVPPALVDALGVSEVKNCAYNRETEIVLLEIENTAEFGKTCARFSQEFPPEETERLERRICGTRDWNDFPDVRRGSK